MNALTTTGALLLGVFAVFFFALLAELSYVLCRRRRSLSTISSPSPDGKELLLFHFLCCKNPSRVEPAGNAPALPLEEMTEEEDEDDLAAKWQMGLMLGSYGPSRFLFTIKEDEREERLSAEDNAGVSGDLRLQIPLDIGSGGDTTPFSTPCSSPPYYTPSQSPGRETDGVSSR